MRHLWSDDSQAIIKEIDSLIENKVELICAKRGRNDVKKLAIKGKSSTNVGDFIILQHPHEPSCSSDKCLFYYPTKKNHLRCFEAERVKKVNDLLVLRYPEAIFDIHQRRHPRVSTPGNSTATFSILNRQRIYSGEVENISLEGAKLVVDVPSLMSVGDTLCHLTLSLCGRFSPTDGKQFHVPEAKVVWLKCDDDRTRAVGVTFALHDKGQDSLAHYISTRSLEDPEDSPA